VRRATCDVLVLVLVQRARWSSFAASAPRRRAGWWKFFFMEPLELQSRRPRVFGEVEASIEAVGVDEPSGPAFVKIVLHLLERRYRVVEKLHNRRRLETSKSLPDVATDASSRLRESLAESAMLRDGRLITNCHDLRPQLVRKPPTLQIFSTLCHDTTREAQRMPRFGARRTSARGTSARPHVRTFAHRTVARRTSHVYADLHGTT
jgi:hypothetical protein